jgi:hypothetical protein
MGSMKRLSIWIGAVTWALAAGAAVGQQMTPPGWSQFNPPLPASPPPPSMEVPVVPKLGVPSQPQVRAMRRESFSDRISRCLDEAAAAGVSPGRRAAYSGACANR